MSTTIREECGCGAKVTITAPLSSSASFEAAHWRKGHKCSVAVAVEPGPCAAQPDWARSDGWQPTCDLRAGHAGAHECDRGPLGIATWPAECTRCNSTTPCWSGDRSKCALATFPADTETESETEA